MDSIARVNSAVFLDIRPRRLFRIFRVAATDIPSGTHHVFTGWQLRRNEMHNY